MQSSRKCALWGLAIVGLLAVAANGSALAAQNAGDATRPSMPAANDPWPEVNLNVLVLDMQDAPQAIDVSGFQLFEDNSERLLHFRATSDSPVSVAILIDTSGSMYKRRELNVAAVKAIAKALPDGSEVMAVLFADSAFLDLPFTPVSRIDYSFLNRVDARGGTALYDAVVAAEKHFAARARYARRAMVLFSDGLDNASTSRMEDAIRCLQRPGAPMFYSFYIADPRASNAEMSHGTRAMVDLAKAGGGVAFTPSRAKDFEPALTRLTNMIRSQYVLRFTTADPARDGKAHSLQVRLPVSGLRILALPAYYAPGK
jgi:VWFA-related protein